MTSSPAPSVLNFKKLADWAIASRASYASAQPFPHAVNTSFLDPEILARAIAEYPDPHDGASWNLVEIASDKNLPEQTLKLNCGNEYRLGATLRTLLHELNSARFLTILEQLTGIQGLIGDPHFVGGGLHQYLPGAVLRVHSDFNMHPRYRFDRRLNLLLYLNEDWQPSWGGDLELWERDMSHCVGQVPPNANTCLIFSTTKDSFHGMPIPLRCPPTVTRKSVALYYYSNGRPEHERYPDSGTLWQRRPGEQGSGR